MSWVTVIWSVGRLVQGPSRPREPDFFSVGNCGGDLCSARAGVDEGDDARTIWDGSSLDACAGLADDRIDCRFRASLSKRRPKMARVDSRRIADGFASPQFRFLSEYQLSGDQYAAKRHVPRRIRFRCERRDESVDADRPVELAVARDLCDGCHNYRVAARGSAQSANGGRQHSVVRRHGDRASGGNNVGNCFHADDGKLVLSRPCHCDGLRAEQ